MGRGDDSAVADTQLMQLVSRFVFGTGSQAADRMGDALNINRRSVQRWLSGQNPVPTNADFWRGLLELVKARQRDLELMRETLEERARGFQVRDLHLVTRALKGRSKNDG